MKVLALVYPGMTLLDLVGPMQAWSFLPGYEVQYAWHRSGAVPTDCGLSVQATHSFEDAWTDPDVLFVVPLDCCEATVLRCTGVPGKPSTNLALSPAANASASTAIGSPEAASQRASTSVSQ